MITSPVMGTYFRAPAPGEKAFVEVGQRVNIDDVVFVIESMKVFTDLNPNVAKAGGLQSQGVKGEAVIGYCDPLTTRDLKSSSFPGR